VREDILLMTLFGVGLFGAIGWLMFIVKWYTSMWDYDDMAEQLAKTRAARDAAFKLLDTATMEVEDSTGMIEGRALTIPSAGLEYMILWKEGSTLTVAPTRFRKNEEVT
jgi:hypothetical protein